MRRDIENAYFTAACQEKIWTRAGPEFGQDEGKVFIILMVLYDLKSGGAAFRAFLAERLEEIVFKSSITDPDVWIRPTTKADDNHYYEFILVYVDYLIAMSQDLVSAVSEFAENFK